jgi:hypothetical protein
MTWHKIRDFLGPVFFWGVVITFLAGLLKLGGEW